ncbi:hypothetical protein PVL29_025319 [Vitis rotundifolia]|uniref:Glycosyltransferase n=1 Tax=Vitis rotundifolia TaxID=103349 RepID=A0AA39D706_VITRO|nr:hypothetical protein PVL29_025319 [Vitis rotundifolia]
MAMARSPKLHIAMYPWFGFGHMTPCLHLSNELADRGHKITFILPRKAQSQLEHLNLHPTLITFHPLTIPHVDGLPPGAETASDHLKLHPTLITFHPLTIPHVDGLPPGAETASDVPNFLHHLLVTAMDCTTDQVEAALRALKPDLLLFDFPYLAPALASKLGIKSIYYSAVCAAAFARHPVPGRQVSKNRPITSVTPPGYPSSTVVLRPHEAWMVQFLFAPFDSTLTTDVPPPGYPSSTVVLRPHEAWMVQFLFAPFGEGVKLYQRLTTGMKGCDAISIRTCQEIERPFCDYIGSQYGKPVLLTGPVLPKPLPTPSKDLWAQWLSGFKPGSVIFCAFGSQNFPEKDQVQELLLGLELTGLPFLVALKPPTGAATIEEALPEGFQDRVGGRGVVHGGWVPQPSILSHPSVGCFVSHCGFGSMWESLTSDPQIVLVPELPDQILNTRLLAEVLKVSVEIEREENGWFSKECLCRAIRSVMDEESEVGGLVRKNHAKWKKTLTGRGFMSNYIDNFVQPLQQLLDKK